jgi:signal transduction histidine kinase
MIIDNLAYSKFKINDKYELPELFFESLKIRESLGMSSGVIANKIHLSEYFQSNNDTLQAQKFAAEALMLAKTTKVSGDMLGSLKQLSVVEHKNASKYSKEYISISDSIQLQERIAQDKFGRIAYETDEISYEKDQLADQNRTLLYFFIGSLMIGLLLFVIRTQRARNRELLMKQTQQKANEDIYNLMISQQNKIEEGRIKEKKRIAQELHDGVLGRLFGARLNLDSLNRMSDEEAVLKRNNYLIELKNIEQDIREISHDLNREKFVIINNFLAILNDLLEQQKASFDSIVEINIDEDIKWDLVGNTLKINIYRIIQESLQNINKYANAKIITVTIRRSGDVLAVNISDDGVGFATTNKKKGIGLQNMISRTQELDGIFDLKSKKGKGTTITVNFPLNSNQLASI